jgi:ABC-type histidine transport system ATPase subunit
LAQQVRMASAGIGSSEATLGRLRAEIAQAKSTFAKSEVELGRSQKLNKANSISQSEFDQTQETSELAKAGLVTAEVNMLEAEQQVNLDRETFKFQEARLADAKLLAPFDGLVIAAEPDIGFVSQKSNLIDFSNARENVHSAMELNGLTHLDAGKHAQELRDSLGVGDRANFEVSMLSGGQQHAAVARH